MAAGLILLGVLLLAVPIAFDYEAAAAPVALFMTPLIVLGVLPPFLFLIVAWRPVIQPTPSVGLVLLVSVVVLTLAQWVTPASSARATDVLWHSIKADLEARGIPIAPGYQPRPPAVPFLLNSLSFAVFAGASVALAVALGKGYGLRSRLWLIVVPLAFALVPRLATVGFGFIFFRISLWSVSVWRPYAEPATFILLSGVLIFSAAKCGQRQRLHSPS